MIQKIISFILIFCSILISNGVIASIEQTKKAYPTYKEMRAASYFRTYPPKQYSSLQIRVAPTTQSVVYNERPPHRWYHSYYYPRSSLPCRVTASERYVRECLPCCPGKGPCKKKINIFANIGDNEFEPFCCWKVRPTCIR